MNMKLKWGAAGGLRRSAVVLGVVGLAATGGLLTAASALAGVGLQPGNLQLLSGTTVVTSGLLTDTVTWQTTTACPSGNNTSAKVLEFASTGGAPLTTISPVNNAVTVPFSGAFNGTVGALLNFAGISATNPGTVEWAVGCYAGSGGTGAVVYEQSTFVTATAAGGYTTSSTGPVIENTTTMLHATPNPVAVGATATLTADVAGVTGSAVPFPAGNVQFENCPTPSTCTNINGLIAVNAGNASAPAVTTTTFSTAGSVNLAAVFTPTATATVAGSSGTFSLAVGSQLAGGTNPVSINVTVPSTGSLSVTVAAGSVTLTPVTPPTTPDETATGTFNNVTIADSRNTFPGWSVSGQESIFTGSGTNTIPANSLGWTPAPVGTLGTGVLIGSAVAPNSPGLGTPQVLVQAHAPNGFGTNTVNAALLLDIPSSTPPGAYAGTLTVTYVSAN